MSKPHTTQSGTGRGTAARAQHAFLICDDEPRVCEMVGAMVKDLGQWDVAHDGMEALAKLSAKTYDLLILDLKIPRLDGLAVLQALRERNQQLRVIVLTAHQELDVAFTAHRTYRIAGYLTKPFQVADLHAAIEKALQHDPQPL